MTSITSEKVSHNPDDDLTIWSVIMKYQLDFTKHFGPKYAYGVCNVEYHSTSEEIHVVARVRKPYHSTKGLNTGFDVPMKKFNVWRKNVKLYSFIS